MHKQVLKRLMSMVMTLTLGWGLLSSAVMSVSGTDPSSNAELDSVLNQSITAGSEAGTKDSPKTATITVNETDVSVSSGDIHPRDPAAAVSFYGTDSTFTTEAGSIDLMPGITTEVYIKVTSQDVTALYYAVSIFRTMIIMPPSSKAELDSVLNQSINAGSEVGTKDSPKTATITVNETDVSVSSGDIHPRDPAATVSFYGTDSTFTTEAGSIDLMPGITTEVYIKVTSQDVTALYYAVSIFRTMIIMPPSSDAELDSVLNQSITAGSEAGTKDSPKTATITVNETDVSVSSGDIHPRDPAAAVSFYGTDSTFTTEAGSIDLMPGATTEVYIKVTAQDGTKAFYKVSIIKAGAPLSSDAGLGSVLNQNINAGSEAGTKDSPKMAGIAVNVIHFSMSSEDIIPHDPAASVSFYGTDRTFTTRAESIDLFSGVATNVYIKVTAQDGTEQYYRIFVYRSRSYEVDMFLLPDDKPSSKDKSGILINGKPENLSTETVAEESGCVVTTITLDDTKIQEKLKNEGNNTLITIPFQNNPDTAVSVLNGQTVKLMETKDAVLEIKTDNVTYTLPAKAIEIDKIGDKMGEGTEPKEIKMQVTVSTAPKVNADELSKALKKENAELVVKPVEFSVVCSSGSQSLEVSKFGDYIERTIALPDGFDPKKVTTGVELNKDGTFSHVPTAILPDNKWSDGKKYYCKLVDRTNCLYCVISNSTEFRDVGNHWSKDAVNDMGARLIVSGVGNGLYEPDRDINRGEFTAILVRALGLMCPGTGIDSFSDVSKTDWNYDAISIAYQYGFVLGYSDGKFKPNEKITREQAMIMIARAMEITGLKSVLDESEAKSLVANYADGASVSGYAKISVASCLKAEIIKGRPNNTVAPADSITRGEVAVIVQRLLQKSSLI